MKCGKGEKDKMIYYGEITRSESRGTLVTLNIRSIVRKAVQQLGDSKLKHFVTIEVSKTKLDFKKWIPGLQNQDDIIRFYINSENYKDVKEKSELEVPLEIYIETNIRNSKKFNELLEFIANSK